LNHFLFTILKTKPHPSILMKAKLTSLFLLLAAPLLHAQSTPALMSYQGRVTDAAGVLIGNTAPVNRAVIFKLYSASSGGTALYAETQSVTISGGEFSVLIGNGTGISGSPGPSSPATTPYKTLADILNSTTYASLYLGITVDDGTSAVDPEISPRQQMVSGAFALRAKVAESVAGSAITTTMLGDSQVTKDKIASGVVDSSRITDLTIEAGDIKNNTINATKLDTTTVGVWTPVGTSVYRNDYVGIGEANPGFPLNFGSVLGDKISLYSNSGSHYGFGIQGNLLQIHTSASSADVAFGYGTSAAMTETMRVKGNGNVGIGTNSPGERLVVAGTAAADKILSSGMVRARGGSYGANGTNAGFSFDTNGDSDGGMFSGADGTLQFYTNGAEKVRIDPSGNVGIQNNSPASLLSVGGNVGGSVASTLLSVYGGTLGSAVNSEIKLASFGCTTGNASTLTVSGFRRVANGGWENSAFILGMNVDSSVRAGGWMGVTNNGIGVQTLDTTQGSFNVGGSLTSVGSRGGSPGYCRVRYDDAGRFFFEGYNTSLNNGSWRGFSIDGNSDIDWQSDRRLKKNIVDAEPMLDRLMQLPFRRFQWKASTNPNEAPEFGVIAQEVEPLFPDIVGRGANDIMTVGYTTFATIACKAVQELKIEKDDELSDVQQQLDEKDEKIAALEARLAAIEKLISSAK
jgi:hypothetical protein